ncbi:MAG TPA: ATP-dependent DNA helicase [Jatrophihabitantaceae bacterium]|nr:ATP-dependent DNA helicase [Jatrophihabitantaceae bacterium]
MTDAAYRLVRPRHIPTPVPELDDAQSKVVTHQSGPLLVLAGPGTGKTTTLVEAAVSRVRDGVPVDNILMLTFSRRAAGELRDRITARLGGTVREPIARTLHSYAFGVLRMANVAAGLPAPRLLSAPEQDLEIRRLLEGRAGEWPAELRPALQTRAFAGELRDLLMRAVERGLNGPLLTQLGERRNRPDWVTAGRFLTEYQQVTSFDKPGSYDPAELINSALNAFEQNPELLRAERSRRRRIFVDEYQDTDPAQAELLALLARGADELILVGDPDQSIYAFRGADESAIRDVDERFGAGRAVPVVALTTSRRAGPTLLVASRRVAERLPGRIEHRRLDSAATTDGSVEVGLFRTASEEAAYVADVLRAAHLDGMPWTRMAVLVRSTATVLGTLRRALVTAGVPVTVRGEDLPLAEQPMVTVLLELLACVQNPATLTEDVAERLLLGPIGGADVVTLRRLRRQLKRMTDADEQVLLAPVLLDVPGVELLPRSVSKPVERVARVLAAGREVPADASPDDVLWAVWNATGLAKRWVDASAAGGVAGAAADRDLDAVVQLFEAAARYTDRLPRATLASFTEHLAAQQIPGDSLARAGEPADAVTILTAHASKGLEWDLVCVAHVQEGSWPDLRRRGSLLGSEHLVDVLTGRDTTAWSAAPQLAEERRLFYVAATRARERLVVTAVSADDEQPSRFLDELAPIDGERALTLPKRGTHLPGLVAELRAVVCDVDAPQDERALAATELARLAEARVRGADPDTWWGLAPVSDDGPPVDPTRPVPISPSRIDAFLRCELRAVLQDLGARDGDTLSASLGTLVHDIAAEIGPDTTRDEIEAMLDARWSGLEFRASWHASNERERVSRILDVLVNWMQTSRDDGLELVDVEREFRASVGDATLSGRVDRLERDEDGRLVVIDYKTGKSRVKADEVSVHPQLAAYQLAVEAGGFGEGERSGGARLVQLAAPGKDPEQRQPPLADADDPGWIAAEIRRVAARMRGSEFSAIVQPACGYCDLKSCCPLFPDGRQVTS